MGIGLNVGNIFRLKTSDDNNIYEVTSISSDGLLCTISAINIETKEKCNIFTTVSNVDSFFIKFDKEEITINEDDEIVSPTRYTSNNIECWDFAIIYDLDYLEATALKYIWRHEFKGGKEDLCKAIQFIKKRKEVSFNKYRFDREYTYHIPRYEDFPSMDITQMTLLHLFSELSIIPEDFYFRRLEQIHTIIEEYMNERY